jgi:hypothetical protein
MPKPSPLSVHCGRQFRTPRSLPVEPSRRSVWEASHIYTRTSAEAERDAAIALERAIYRDLFRVVPNNQNRNNFAALD